MPIATSSQTIGPFWHLLQEKDWDDLTRFGAEGEAITLTGIVKAFHQVIGSINTTSHPFAFHIVYNTFLILIRD